jgi:hypothetical protein
VLSYRSLADAFIKYLSCVIVWCAVLSSCCHSLCSGSHILFQYTKGVNLYFHWPYSLSSRDFAKLQKNRLLDLSFLSVFLSVLMSLHAHGTTRLPLDGFSRNLLLEDFFLKYVAKIQFSLQSNKNNRYFTWRPTHILITYRWLSLKMRNVSEKM